MMPWEPDHPGLVTAMTSGEGSPPPGAGDDGAARPDPVAAIPTIMTIATSHRRR